MIVILQFKVCDYCLVECWFSCLLCCDKEEEFIKYCYIYGQLLKMNEKYIEVIEEFQLFFVFNFGDSLEILVKNEIFGVELALEFF